MKRIILNGMGAVIVAALLLTGAGGCDGHDDDDTALAAVLVIFNLDANHDGAPDTYQYQVQVTDKEDSELLDRAPTVKLPSGVVLPTTCAVAGKQTVCQTGLQTPPAPSGKADIPAGTYQVLDHDRSVLEFSVTAAVLAAGDPASVDLTTLAPATPGTMTDPAVLAWAAIAPGTAGTYWSYRIENIDAGDDNGQSVSGSSPDWATSNFSLALPAGWDSTDPLLVEIDAVAIVAQSGYTEVIVVQSIVTGYTRL
jgi:hypothetical protein